MRAPSSQSTENALEAAQFEILSTVAKRAPFDDRQGAASVCAGFTLCNCAQAV